MGAFQGVKGAAYSHPLINLSTGMELVQVLNGFEELLKYAKHVAEGVNEVIAELVRGEPSELYEASMHLIRAGGKRLRPLALTLAGRMYGLSESLGIRAGASVEVLHNFTLIHDDIMDKDRLRRGVPTVHTIYGTEKAIIAGDLLFAKAFEALTALVNYGVSPGRIVSAVKELSWASVTVAEGQALDMSFEARSDVSVEDYITMVFKKTAALFKASLVIGALLAGAPEEEVEKLTEYGSDIGIAFQIRDDVLGLVGNEKVLGKPVLSDLREGKRTVLVIYALSKLGGEERSELLKALGNKEASIEELRRAAELIRSTGAMEYADQLAEKYVDNGLEALNSTNAVDNEAKEMLKKLALYITQRKY